jgi:hypothetical protein
MRWSAGLIDRKLSVQRVLREKYYSPRAVREEQKKTPNPAIRIRGFCAYTVMRLTAEPGG